MQTAAGSIVVNETAWQDTYERARDEVFRDLVAAGVPPREAIDALREAFVQGRDDGEDECTVTWLIAAASGIWRRRRWRERLLGPLAHGRKAPVQRAHGWLSHASKRGRDRVGALMAATGLAVPLLVVAVMVADPRSAVVEPPSAPLPTASPAAPTPTATPVSGALPEAEAWAAVWSLSRDVPVLRPGWLPQPVGPRIFHYSVATPGRPFTGYRLEYIELGTGVGQIVPQIQFAAGQAEDVERSLMWLGGPVREAVTVRGRPGELGGNGAPFWHLVWSERGYRYAVQAFGFSREDVLRIAESLAPVIDDTGRTRVDNLVPFVTAERW